MHSDGGHNTGERKTQTQATSHLHYTMGAACCKEARLAAGQAREILSRGCPASAGLGLSFSQHCAQLGKAFIWTFSLTLCISIRPEIQFAG